MWRTLLGGSKPDPQPEPPEATQDASPSQQKEVIGALPNKPASSDSGFFDPPKLPPSPRTLARKRQQDAAKASPTSTENKSITRAEDAPTKVDSAEKSPTKSPQLENVAKGTWTPPQSPRSQPSSPEKSSNAQKTPEQESTKEPSWVTSPGSAMNGPATTATSNNTRSPPNNQQDLDRREIRLRYSEFFVEGIAMIEEERRKEIATSSNPQNDSQSHKADGGITVFVRKRPLDDSEKGDYDVVRVESSAETPISVVVIYNTSMEWATKTRTIKPVTFGAAAVFDENKTSADVYYRALKPLVESVRTGGIATLLMYGQTGSGKSHTMDTLQGMTARDIFTGLPPNYTVKVSFIEICGKQCRDLLDETPSPVRVADNDDGSVRFVNARLQTVTFPEDLQDALVNAKKRRSHHVSSGATGASNLSHAVCRITVVPPSDSPEGTRPGSLTLVDCAGTEKRMGKHHHDKDRRAERAEINASLWALKECLRAKASSTNRSDKNIPYDYSSLTRVLRESLEKDDASFHVVATVSPKASDTEHTIDTLLTVSSVIEGTLDELTAEQAVPSTGNGASGSVPPPPKAWDHSQLCDWLVRKHLIKDTESIPNDMTGRKIMRLSKKELQDAFYTGEDCKKGDLLFRCLRAETDRVARLDVKHRMAIERARKNKETNVSSS